MKIFCNRFALCLQSGHPLQGVKFESLPFEEAVSRFAAQPPLFPGQTFYADAGKGPKFAEKVFEFHTRPLLDEFDAEFVIVFEDENSLQEFYRDYSALFRSMEAAGGLVMNTADELLLIFRLGHWDLPKGKLEKGEKMAEAAWREVSEETGLKKHQMGEKFAETIHIFPRSSGWAMKTTWWYLMSLRENENLVPQGEEGITQIEWKPLRNLCRELPDTWPLINQLIRRLCRKYPQ